MKVEKISDARLKITDEVIKHIKKEDLEEDKLMLENKLKEINTLLNVFKEIK